MKKNRRSRILRTSTAKGSAQTLEDMMSAFQSALLDQVRHRLNRLVRKYGAQYAGLGKPHRAGKLVEKSPLHVRFYVARKLERVTKERAIPKVLKMSIRINEKPRLVKIPTDVVVAPTLRILAAEAGQIAYIYNKNDPDERGSGTAIVRSESTQTTYLLTAGHVVACNQKVVTPTLEEDILRESDVPIGKLKYAPTITTHNPIDAALVSVKTSDYQVVVRRSLGPVQEMRTPVSLHSGESEDFELLSWRQTRTMKFVAILHDMPVPSIYAAGDVVFPELLEFAGNAKPGDSGALMIDSNNCAVGLHILGDPNSGSSLCIPIQTVLDSTIQSDRLALVY